MEHKCDLTLLCFAYLITDCFLIIPNRVIFPSLLLRSTNHAPTRGAARRIQVQMMCSFELETFRGSSKHSRLECVHAVHNKDAWPRIEREVLQRTWKFVQGIENYAQNQSRSLNQ